MTAAQWIAAFAARLGLEPPGADATERLLALAATAAHDSERIAAPIACYLAALSDLDLSRVAGLAEGIASPDDRTGPTA